MTNQTRLEPVAGDSCDAIVIGAGLVGAAVATQLAREGLETAVLEARRVSGGATGRNLGLAALGVAGHYSEAVAVYGRQRAREIWALTAGGRDRLIEAAQRLRVPVLRGGSYTLADDEKEVETLHESARLLQEDGFHASVSTSDPLGRGFKGALYSPDDVIVDAGTLARALLESEEVIVHEGTEVHALEQTREGIRVWAHRRTVVCSAVVLAVNGYAALVDPYLSEKVSPVPYVSITTEPLNDPLPDQSYAVAGGRALLRSLSDGRLRLAARRREGPPADEKRQADVLVDLLSRRFPELHKGRAHQRTEVTGSTPDGLPLVGRLPSPRQGFFAVGFEGRGLSWAFVAAERLVDVMLKRSELGLLSIDRLADGHARS